MMIKESCRVIGREIILVYYFKSKYHVKEKTLLFCKKLIKVSLWPIFNLAIYKGILASLGTFGRGWAHQVTPNQK